MYTETHVVIYSLGMPSQPNIISEECVAKLVHGVLLLYLVDISLHYNYNASWL